MKQALKALGHLALGGAAAAVAPHIVEIVPFIPHINPLTGAILGSALSSIVSAYAKPPNAATSVPAVQPPAQFPSAR